MKPEIKGGRLAITPKGRRAVLYGTRIGARPRELLKAVYKKPVEYGLLEAIFDWGWDILGEVIKKVLKWGYAKPVR